MPVTLGSDWGAEGSGLNKHLIAKIYPVDSEGKADVLATPNNTSDANSVVVAAPLTDGNLDLTLNWQSAFENTGTDSKLPAISQLLQSGQASVMLNLIAGLFPSDPDSKIGKVNAALKETAKQAEVLKGRTGITKLNSLQVFTGLPPIKIPITMYFRAWADPMKEVESPINQLFAWALPQDLANSSVLAGALEKILEGKVPDLNTVFPSTIPRFVALEYGGRTYKPLVIESIGHPLVLPRSKDGAMLSASVQLTLSTLTAWGKADYERATIGTFNIPVAGVGTTTEAF